MADPSGSGRLAVLGIGAHALATAAHLCMDGHRVRWWSPDATERADVRASGGIACEGLLEDHVSAVEVVDAAADALADAEAVLVAAPASLHRRIAVAAARSLSGVAWVMLGPGRTGGALEFRHTVASEGGPTDLTVIEAVSSLYGCRMVGPARVVVRRLKRVLPVAVLPASKTDEAMRSLLGVVPQSRALTDVLVSGLQNVGGVLHPAPLLFNATRTEGVGRYEFYLEGITPFVAAYLGQLDDERLRIAEALEVDGVLSLGEWLQKSLGAQGPDLMAWKSVYADSPGPDSMAHRYVLDDVPYSLVPMSALAQVAGLAVPATDALIEFCCVAYRRDFRDEGRHLGRMGLGGSLAELLQVVQHG